MASIVLILGFLAAQAGAAPDNSASSAVSVSSPATTPTPCRNPDAAGKYHIGCGVTAPVMVHQVQPSYPDSPRLPQICSGSAARFTVTAEGIPTDIRFVHSAVDRSTPETKSIAETCDAAFLSAIQQSRYRPAQFRGKPVAVELILENFID